VVQRHRFDLNERLVRANHRLRQIGVPQLIQAAMLIEN